MVESKSQRKASEKYKAANVRQVKLNFFPKDHDVHDWLKSKPKMTEYIISLIREDMSRHQ